MRLLALETSEYVSSVALLVDGEVVTEQTFESRMNLCETLARRIGEVLGQGLACDGLAVSLGPGSFTGLRVGVATAKALAHVRRLPLVGVGTQEAIALHATATPGEVIGVIQKARQGHVYAGLWEQTTTEIRQRAVPRVIAVDELPEFLGLDTTMLVGPGLAETLPENVEWPRNLRLQMLYPSATAVARLAAGRMANANPEACFTLQPLYLLASQAERARQLTVTPGTIPRRRLLLRRGCLEDLPDIVRIEELSFPTPWPDKALLDEVTRTHNGLFLVAECDGVVAGYLGAWLYAGEAHIYNVAVDPVFRRSGLAEILLLVMMEHAIKTECEITLLEYRAGNEPAAGLYAKLGFQRLGLRKRYYQDTGEDAIVAAIKDLKTYERQAALSELRQTWEERHHYDLQLAL